MAQPKKITNAQHRAVMKKLLGQPFVVVTNETLPYVYHMPPDTVLHAHKLINGAMGPSYRPRASTPGAPAISYAPGTTHVEPHANTLEGIRCARGLHVATWEWLQYVYVTDVSQMSGTELMAVVEFKRSDVAAFPTDRGVDWQTVHSGKFRLHRLKVLLVSVIDAKFFKIANRPRYMLGLAERKRRRETGYVARLDASIFAVKPKKVK